MTKRNYSKIDAEFKKGATLAELAQKYSVDYTSLKRHFKIPYSIENELKGIPLKPNSKEAYLKYYEPDKYYISA